MADTPFISLTYTSPSEYQILLNPLYIHKIHRLKYCNSSWNWSLNQFPIWKTADCRNVFFLVSIFLWWISIAQISHGKWISIFIPWISCIQYTVYAYRGCRYLAEVKLRMLFRTITDKIPYSYFLPLSEVQCRFQDIDNGNYSRPTNCNNIVSYEYSEQIGQVHIQGGNQNWHNFCMPAASCNNTFWECVVQQAAARRRHWTFAVKKCRMWQLL